MELPRNTKLDELIGDAQALALKLDALGYQRAQVDEQIAFLKERSTELRRKSALINGQTAEVWVRSRPGRTERST